MKTIDTRHGPVKGIFCDPSEVVISTFGADNVVRIWDQETLTLKEAIEVTKRNKSVSDLTFLNYTLFSSGIDGSVRLLRNISN